MNLTNLQRFIQDLKDDLVKEIEEYLFSITVSGSFAAGNLSKKAPDINLQIFLTPTPPPSVYIKIGEVIRRIARKYKDYFGLRVDFRPFSFPPPIVKRKPMISLHLMICDMSQKNLPRPFGIPKFVLRGLTKSYNVLYGEDPFKEIDLSISYDEILKDIIQDCGIIEFILTRLPVTKDPKEECSDFFYEVYMLAKVLFHFILEVGMKKQEIEKFDDLVRKLLTDKRLLVTFCKERIGEEEAKIAEKILKVKENFLDWMDNHRKAAEFYKETLKLVRLLKRRVAIKLKRAL